MNGTDAHMFEVRFAGEGSQDVGGPFREMLTNLVAELESETLPLLIKTPNHRNDHGQSRESYTLNPSSISPTHGELFKFFGFFLGFCLRTGSAMDWHFPPLFWKQLMGESVGLSDLEGLDAYSYQVLRDLNKYGRELDAEKFNAAVVETFTTLLSNGQEVELRPDGASVAVTQANHQEFVNAVLKARLDECEKQMNWLKEGIAHVIDLSILSFLTWEEVEIRACGPKDIDVVCSSPSPSTAHAVRTTRLWFGSGRCSRPSPKRRESSTSSLSGAAPSFLWTAAAWLTDIASPCTVTCGQMASLRRIPASSPSTCQNTLT